MKMDRNINIDGCGKYADWPRMQAGTTPSAAIRTS